MYGRGTFELSEQLGVAVWCELNMISDVMPGGILVTRNMISDSLVGQLTIPNVISDVMTVGHREYNIRRSTSLCYVPLFSDSLVG